MINLTKLISCIGVVAVLVVVSGCGGGGGGSSSSGGGNSGSIQGVATPTNLSVVTAQNAGN